MRKCTVLFFIAGVETRDRASLHQRNKKNRLFSEPVLGKIINDL